MFSKKQNGVNIDEHYKGIKVAMRPLNSENELTKEEYKTANLNKIKFCTEQIMF